MAADMYNNRAACETPRVGRGGFIKNDNDVECIGGGEQRVLARGGV